MKLLYFVNERVGPTTIHKRQFIVLDSSVTDVFKVFAGNCASPTVINANDLDSVDGDASLYIKCPEDTDSYKAAEFLEKTDLDAILVGPKAMRVAMQLSVSSDYVVYDGKHVITRDIKPNATQTLIRCINEHQFDFPRVTQFIVLTGQLARAIHNSEYVVGRRSGETLLRFSNGRPHTEQLWNYSKGAVICVDAGSDIHTVKRVMQNAICDVVFVCEDYDFPEGDNVSIYENIEDLCKEKVRCLEYRHTCMGRFVY